MSAPAGLDHGNLAMAFWEACDGASGQLMRVITMALLSTIRDGHDVVTRDVFLTRHHRVHGSKALPAFPTRPRVN